MVGRLTKSALVLVLMLIGTAVHGVELIAHREVGVTQLTLNQVRSIFGMRRTSWPDGKPVRVFVLAGRDNRLHDAFCREVLALYPYQISTSWNRLVYSGMGEAPEMVADEAEMLRRVASTPGAIGYLEKVGGDDAVHTIEIR